MVPMNVLLSVSDTVFEPFTELNFGSYFDNEYHSKARVVQLDIKMKREEEGENGRNKLLGLSQTPRVPI